MSDYSKFPYKRLLDYIENGCQKINEERDFVHYLLSMENSETIEELINRYNNLFKLLAVIFFATNKLPSAWYMPKTWGYKNEYLLDKLNQCFNESIQNWLRKQANPTLKQCIICLANLRSSGNLVKVQGEVLKYIADGKEVNIDTLISKRNKQNWILENIAFKSSFEYKDQRDSYISYSKYLVGNGHIFDVREIAFGKDHGIEYDNMLEQYNKEAEQERLKLLEDEKQKEKERREKIIRIVFSSIIGIVLFVLILFLFKNISAFSIIIIIGLIGSIPTLLFKGKF